MRGRWLWLAPLAIVGFAVFVALGGIVVRALWNWLLPPLFGWHVITFWQALGLLVLCRMLFGGLGLNGGPRRSAEHRARFRQRIHERFGGGRDPEATEGGTAI